MLNPIQIGEYVSLVCPQCGRHFSLPVQEAAWLREAKARFNFGLRIICSPCGKQEQLKEWFRRDNFATQRRERGNLNWG